MTVTAAADSTILYGMRVSELQQNVSVGNNAITGTSMYIANYSEAFDIPYSNGNYIALHAVVPGVDDVTITVITVGAFMINSNGDIVVHISDKNSQTLTVVASKDGYEPVSFTYSLAGIICEPDPALVAYVDDAIVDLSVTGNE